ncbi:VWA domain-containing protein [Pedococcus sp. KACC 23699]|uniref:VWA domain-containing protein n=1 Tax=Pedococcus sp. KACC 23699 TaxID=3149228 RepID=A0AAU7JPG8_9MICO
MSFTWPWMLLGLVAVPLLVVAYRAQQRRRDARRDGLAAIGLVPVGGIPGSDRSPHAATVSGTAAPRRPRRDRLRHLAPVLMLAALTVLLVSLARPTASVAEPRREGTVVLAFDISTSMAAKDISPTRLEAAKAAARTFVQRQPSDIRIGVVAFGDSALVSQQPTEDRTQVLGAINRLTPQGATAVGRGIVSSLSAIAGKPIEVGSEPGAADQVEIGYYRSAAIVLLSDGENTTDPDPLEIADLASAAGVKIYTIGVGSTQGTVLQVDGFQISTALDEASLRKISQTTGGTYYAAADSSSLSRVYGSIDLAWTARTQEREVTSWFATAAAVLLLLGAGVSVLRSGRVV